MYYKLENLKFILNNYTLNFSFTFYENFFMLYKCYNIFQTTNFYKCYDFKTINFKIFFFLSNNILIEFKLLPMSKMRKHAHTLDEVGTLMSSI